ncbi:hypothetical protein TWF594_003045 [Orbilia oligospora]|nr:hypothetical protein TWF594_003045 [Orbilia oligospora]
MEEQEGKVDDRGRSNSEVAERGIVRDGSPEYASIWLIITSPSRGTLRLVLAVRLARFMLVSTKEKKKQINVLGGREGQTERENKKIRHFAAAFLTGTAKIWVQPWDPSEHRHGFKEQQSRARFSTAIGIWGKCGYN